MAIRPQRPGMIDPQERRRRPLNPLEDYPYEPEMPEVPMPQMGALPVPDITPGMAAPRLAPVNPTGWDTPPQDLSQFRAWYSGQPVEGAPAAPEWGKDTQTYSRLNPVQPRTTPTQALVPPRTMKGPAPGQTLGGGQPQVMQRPRGPVRPNAPMPSFNAPMGQQAMEQMQAREQRFFTPQQGPTMAAGMQQMAQAGMRPMPSPVPVQGPTTQPPINQARRQFLGRSAENLQVIPQASATPAQGLMDAATRRAQEAVMAGAAGPLAGTLTGKGGAAGYRTLPQVGRDFGLELAAGTTLLAGMGVDLADLTTRSLGMMNPNFDPSSPGGFQALRSASESIDRVGEEILAQRTPEYLQRKQEFDRKLEAAPQDVMSQIASYAAAVYDDPSMAEEAIISNLPQMIPSIAAGKIASIGKAAKAIKSARALSATSATGFLQTGVDAQKSSYDTLKQQYASQGMSPKQADQLAFQNSLLSFFAGSALGAVGGRTGLEQAAFGTGTRGAMQRAGRVAAEFGTEALEEATPQAITNVQLGRPVTQGLGRTIAETAIATAPFAGMAALGRSDGGASKVPDALQSEAGSPPTGTTTQMPPSEQQRRYADWVAAGGTPAPFASRVGLQRSRQLPGRGALPAGPTEGQRALPPVPTQPEPPSARVEAPFQPSPPTAPAGMRPQAPTQAGPVTSPSPEVSFRPLETVGAEGARPVRLYERPILQSALQGQGINVQAEIEDKYPALLDEYEAKVVAGKRVKAAPLPSDVKGQYGMAASRMHHTADVILEKLMRPYGIEAKGRRRDIYPEVLGNIVTEMQEIVPGITQSEVESAAKAGTKAEGRMREGAYDIWERWQERFGKEKGLSDNDTLRMKNLVAGRKGLFFRPDVQAALGLNPGDPEVNKQVQDVIRRDMAKLMGMPAEIQGKPLKGLSLTTISPQVWTNWMSLRGFNNEAEFPGFREELEDILRNEGRISDSAVRGEGPTSAAPSAPKAPKTPPAPVAPRGPVAPPAPVTPTPTGPSGKLKRYRGMRGIGIPGAPRSFAPGVPSGRQGAGFTRRPGSAITTGRPQGPQGIRGLLPAIDEETREEQEARMARERLKKRSPFARERQAEQERIGQAVQGRRPPTPPEAVTPTPAPPTPPPAPTPAGEAVTPPVPKAAPVKKEPAAPKPTPATGQPINERTLTDRGWAKQKPDSYSGPNGEKLERDADRRGEPWVYTDRAGNTQGFPSAREAIKAIISEPETAPTPVKAEKPAKKAAPVKKATTPPVTPKVMMRTPNGEPVALEDMQEAGIDVPYLESLAKKYGAPPAPVVDSAGILGPLGRAANMLERAASKAKSADELAEILKHAQRIKAHRAVIEIARNPNTNDETFEKAVENKEANKYVNSSYWDSLRARRAERAKAATPPPKPAEQTGKEMVEELFGESQRKQDAFDSINPDLPNSMAGYIEQFGTSTEKAEYAELQALEAKAKAARERKPGDPPSGFGRVSQARRRTLKEKMDSLLPNLGAIQRARTSALNQEPVDAATVDKYGIKLPEGYVKQGNRYVYQKGKAAPVPETTQAREKAIDVPKMRKVIRNLRTGPMVDFTTVASFKDSDLASVRQYALELLTGQSVPVKDATFKRFMNELAAALNVPVTTPSETVKAVDRVLRDIEEEVIKPASTKLAAAKGVETAPAEAKEIFREIDSGKNKRTVRRRVQDDYKDGKKALFVTDNIEQIIAEAEATGKVTKICP